MSAKMAGSSAPGTPWPALAGIMCATTHRSDRCSASVSTGDTWGISASVEQMVETFLDAVGDVQGERLDRGRWVDAAGGDEQAAVDDEQVFDVVTATPGVHD